MKALFLCSILFIQTAVAGVSFDDTNLPETVEKIIERQVQKKCPILSATESLKTKAYHRYLGDEMFEFHIKISGRGHGTGDPEYDIAMIVKWDDYSNEATLVKFETGIPCF